MLNKLKGEVEQGSTFTLMSDLSCIASTLFVNINFTYVRTSKLCDTGNQPQDLRIGIVKKCIKKKIVLKILSQSLVENKKS